MKSKDFLTKMPSQIKNCIKLPCSHSAALANMLTVEFGLAKPIRAEPSSELPLARTPSSAFLFKPSFNKGR